MLGSEPEDLQSQTQGMCLSCPTLNYSISGEVDRFFEEIKLLEKCWIVRFQSKLLFFDWNIGVLPKFLRKSRHLWQHLPLFEWPRCKFFNFSKLSLYLWVKTVQKWFISILPDFYVSNLHCRLLWLPGTQPRVLSHPKVFHRSGRFIIPRLFDFWRKFGKKILKKISKKFSKKFWKKNLKKILKKIL